MNAAITWFEDNGVGYLFCDFEDGTRHTEPWDTPIDSSTDSHQIANLFGNPLSVDHDREFIHVNYQES